MKQQVENFIYLDAVTSVVDKHEEDIQRVLKQQELIVDRIQSLENKCRQLCIWLVITVVIFFILLFALAFVLYFVLG